MACVWSGYALSLSPPPSLPRACHFLHISRASIHVPSLLERPDNSIRFGTITSNASPKKHEACQEEEEVEKKHSIFVGQTSETGRREAFFKMALTALAFPGVVPNAIAETDAAPVDFRVYTDDVNKFQISIPQDWQVGAGEPSGFKSVTAFYPEGTSTSNVSVAITGLRPDFTRMESFGKVEGFAETLVGGLDRSWQRPPGVTAKLIDCKASKGIYYIEYTLQNPGESRRHLFSALGMAFNGWYNRLYTVTGQFLDEEEEKYGSKVQKAVSSFRFI